MPEQKSGPEGQERGGTIREGIEGKSFEHTMSEELIKIFKGFPRTFKVYTDVEPYWDWTRPSRRFNEIWESENIFIPRLVYKENKKLLNIAFIVDFSRSMSNLAHKALSIIHYIIFNPDYKRYINKFAIISFSSKAKEIVIRDKSVFDYYLYMNKETLSDIFGNTDLRKSLDILKGIALTEMKISATIVISDFNISPEEFYEEHEWIKEMGKLFLLVMINEKKDTKGIYIPKWVSSDRVFKGIWNIE